MRSTPIITGLMLVGAAVYILGLATLLLWFDVWWVSFISTSFLWLHYKDPALLAERIWKATGPIARKCATALFRTSGKHPVS